jgi:hypothetical protein
MRLALADSAVLLLPRLAASSMAAPPPRVVALQGRPLTIYRREGSCLLGCSPWRRATGLFDAYYFFPDRPKRNAGELEMRPSERNSDDRDSETERCDEVTERQPPSGEHQPDQIADETQRAADCARRTVDHGVPERQKRVDRDRQCGPRPRQADDCDRHDHGREQPSRRHPGPTEYDPEQIEQYARSWHESPTPILRWRSIAYRPFRSAFRLSAGQHGARLLVPASSCARTRSSHRGGRPWMTVINVMVHADAVHLFADGRF